MHTVLKRGGSLTDPNFSTKAAGDQIDDIRAGAGKPVMDVKGYPGAVGAGK